ncbi:hypothetical protein ES705_37935 [subsurface metagenome]
MFFFAIVIACSANGQEKTKIKKAKDLPIHNYQLSNTNLSEFIDDDKLIIDLANTIEKDLKDDLNKYEFADNSILKGYYDDLNTIAQIKREYEKSLKYVYKSRQLADKEAERLIRACEFEAYALAKKENFENDDKFKEFMKAKLAFHLDSLPFNIIQEDVERRKGRADLFNENLLIGFLTSELQTTVNNSEGNVPLDVAMGILNIKATMDYYLPNKEVFKEVFTDLINRKAVKIEKHDIWKERNVTLKESDNYRPVVIGIWDTGVDVEIFPENNRWINKNEVKDGKDNDENGFIDDIFGIAYDYEGRKSEYILIPEADNMGDLDEMQELMRGLIDVMANVDSDRAKALKEKTSAMTPEEYEQFFETLRLLGNYNHGTHVAGIATEGNPYARILTARLTFDHKNIPDVPTIETAERWAKMYADVLEYFRNNKVRVVNMSWSVDLRIDILQALRKNGIGKDEEERFEIAKKMFSIHEEAFYKAMESTPEILFITSAGNSNNDVDFAGSIPSSFNFPNILTVGAVDIEGLKTSFTTEGESVDVFANGYEVESYIPGGDRVKFSGTSMSSPNIVNLAAKIFSVNPKLTAREVKEIIIENATASKEDPGVLLIHPAKSIEAAQHRL